MDTSLRVVVVKPSKYAVDGSVERFRWGFMPNSTLPYVRSMTPGELGGTRLDIHTVDEYVHTDLRYLSLLRRAQGCQTLVALVGVQSHQFHRALDLAAYAQQNGCLTVIGGGRERGEIRHADRQVARHHRGVGHGPAAARLQADALRVGPAEGEHGALDLEALPRGARTVGDADRVVMPAVAVAVPTRDEGTPAASADQDAQ